ASAGNPEPGRDDAREDHEHEDVGQRPVPELDELVEALGLAGDRDVRAGHARPDPVTRTRPPVTTITICATTPAPKTARSRRRRTARASAGAVAAGRVRAGLLTAVIVGRRGQ